MIAKFTSDFIDGVIIIYYLSDSLLTWIIQGKAFALKQFESTF